MIVERQEMAAWGSGFLDQLAKDLRSEFPDLKGFSRSNLAYIRKWYRFYQNTAANVPQLVGQIPWGHNRLLLDKVSSVEEACFYAEKTIEHGWSRAVLAAQIETELFQRKGRAITNFEHTLPALQSELAEQTLRDPYVFDFLTLAENAKERDLEKGLLEHITKFLLELGAGFALVANQYHLEIDERDFYIDLLFYHLKLRCFVVIDLKTDAFKPEYAGKMNFYLSAADDLLRSPEDKPTIGILLCKESGGRTIAEYTLRNIAKPLGVSEFTHSLPSDLRNQLPSVEALKAELQDLTPSEE